ncbi:MAG TPA: peptidylprolyl isomerase [Pirellulales bacterium]|nr:peptidylprolyl isomerase [Pirellulales bacterium]
MPLLYCAPSIAPPNLFRRWRLAFFALLVCGLASAIDAAEPGAKKPSAQTKRPTPAEPAVAATVGKEPVYVAEVDDVLAGTRQARSTGSPPAELRGPALAQAINRRLVAQYLMQHGYAIDDEETDELIKELKRKLETQKLTYDEFLERHGFNETIVRRRLQWDALWSQFLKNEANDEALAAFFQRHQRDYDGSELRVSHILWPVKPTDDPTRLAAALEEADDIRAKIVGGKMTFAEAAQKYSAGPSRRKSGDLGFIPARDVMSEAFSKAAFTLDKGGLSKPVVDQFGVHLITCTDIKPGERTWREARRELVDAFAREKFLELADAQRKQVPVKIVDGVQ